MRQEPGRPSLERGHGQDGDVEPDAAVARREAGVAERDEDADDRGDDEEARERAERKRRDEERVGGDGGDELRADAEEREGERGDDEAPFAGQDADEPEEALLRRARRRGHGVAS